MRRRGLLNDGTAFQSRFCLGCTQTKSVRAESPPFVDSVRSPSLKQVGRLARRGAGERGAPQLGILTLGRYRFMSESGARPNKWFVLCPRGSPVLISASNPAVVICRRRKRARASSSFQAVAGLRPFCRLGELSRVCNAVCAVKHDLRRVV
jgi:hypothetical protein